MKTTLLRTCTYFVLSMVIALLWSCEKDEPIESPQSPKTVTNHKVSVEEAIERASLFRASLPGKAHTRANESDVIESVQIVSTSDAKTRSCDSDTLFYILKYQDNKGFAMVSADDRMMPVYAMSDEGSLNLNDTIFNPGLKAFYNAAINDGINSITNPGISIGISPFDMRFDRTCSPKLSKEIRELGQRSPYNKYCYTSTGESALVGCGPVAVGSILAYLNHPNELNGHPINWESINSYFKCDDLFFLLAEIGSPEYLNVNYGINSTSCYTNKIPYALSKCGISYSNWESFERYKAAAAIESAPILIFGHDNGGNHFWVMDGYIRYSNNHPVTSLPEVGAKFPVFYFHCCWGWNGSSNGYYYFNLDGAINGTAHSYNSDDFGTSSSIYEWDLTMITDIKVAN